MNEPLTIQLPQSVTVHNRQKFKEMALAQVTNKGTVVFDFAKAGYVDAAALGMMVGVSRRSMDADLGKVSLVNLSPDLIQLIKVTKLTEVFDLPGVDLESDQAVL